jgi:glutamate racemase
MNHLAKAIESQDDILLQKSLENLAKFKSQKDITIGLGCTHYSFAKEEILKYFDNQIEILDVSSSVAKYVIQNISLENFPNKNHKIFTTSNNPDQLSNFIELKLGLKYKAKKVVL